MGSKALPNHTNCVENKMTFSCLFFFVIALAIQASKQDSCNCHWRELDLCAATALISMQGSPVPQSEENIDEQCTYITEAMDCFLNYTNKCTTPLHRELLSFVVEGSQASVKEYCTSGSELRKMILEHAACLADSWTAQRSCILDAQAGAEILDETPFDKRITVMCCTFQRYADCGMGIAVEKCGEDIREFIQKFTSLFVSELPNVLCNGYGPESKKCEGVLPPPGTPPKGTESESPISRAFGLYLSLDK